MDDVESMHSNVLPLLLLLSCASARCLTVSAACALPAGAGSDVFVELRCANEADCGAAPDAISIEFIGMDVGAYPVSWIAWIDAKGRASLQAPEEGPRHMVWALPQAFAVDSSRALLSLENAPLTPEFDLRRDCSRLNAAALALLKAKH